MTPVKIRKPRTKTPLEHEDQPSHVSITLPYPPSVNGLWCTVRGRRTLSAGGRAYRLQVQNLALVARYTGALPKNPLRGPLTAVLLASPPQSNRKRDLDNLLKATLDALGAAGIYGDDSQIHDLRILWHGIAESGSITVNLFKQTGANQ